jgi:hypothetical protein
MKEIFRADILLIGPGNQIQDVTGEKLIKIWGHVWENRFDLKERYKEVRRAACKRAEVHFDLVEEVISSGGFNIK